ncbi:MAG: hypothetical protein BGP13_02795 [Sphingobacteriales bacterium 40-81]|nr:MAG: hypothetical protein BGP13_02795 [Sphingobacteriales bacterium 40-81]
MIRETLEDYFNQVKTNSLQQLFAELLSSRKEIAKHLDNISLVNLHAWVKEGLPYHKQGGRVYFLKSEVIEYIKGKSLKVHQQKRKGFFIEVCVK